MLVFALHSDLVTQITRYPARTHSALSSSGTEDASIAIYHDFRSHLSSSVHSHIRRCRVRPIAYFCHSTILQRLTFAVNRNCDGVSASVPHLAQEVLATFDLEVSLIIDPEFQDDWKDDKAKKTKERVRRPGRSMLFLWPWPAREALKPKEGKPLPDYFQIYFDNNEKAPRIVDDVFTYLKDNEDRDPPGVLVHNASFRYEDKDGHCRKKGNWVSGGGLLIP